MIRICAAVLYVTAAHSPSLAWGFGVRLPRVAPRHTRARVATSMGRGTKSKSSQATTDYYTILSDGSDAWRADGAVDILSRGGCGVLPTDTGCVWVRARAGACHHQARRRTAINAATPPSSPCVRSDAAAPDGGSCGEALERRQPHERRRRDEILARRPQGRLAL